MTVRLDPVPRAIAAIAAGHPVVVVDDADRENEGDLVFAAAAATTELMGLAVRHGSGVVCVAMPGADLDRLRLSPMTHEQQDPLRTAYAVSTDASDGVTTGISAADRARTTRVLADPASTAAALRRPGHVFPLRYREGGVLVRRGHTEAAVDLARLAGLPPAGVLVELVDDEGALMRGEQLRRFADARGLPMISIDDLVRHRRRTEQLLVAGARSLLPTRHGDFTAQVWTDTTDGTDHLALVHGDVASTSAGVLVRVHSECLTGDVLGSTRCDCGAQLEDAKARVVAAGAGVIVYLRGHEGRGVGIAAKLAAYRLQDQGRDTVEANLDLGLPVDARHYGAAAQILRGLGVPRIRLLTNNPDKVEQLRDLGIDVLDRVPLPPRVTAPNLAYLRTKRDRLGHDLDDLDLADLDPYDLDHPDTGGRLDTPSPTTAGAI